MFSNVRTQYNQQVGIFSAFGVMFEKQELNLLKNQSDKPTIGRRSQLI